MSSTLTVILRHPRLLVARHPSLTLNRTYSTSLSNDLISELESRSLISHLTSRSLVSHLSTSPRTVYSGVDPSASSLHVGNLLPLFTLAHFARYNHKPIVLVGGATGSIGDPSGRSTERNALDKKELEENVEGIKSQLRSFFGNVQEYYGIEGEEGEKEGEVGMGVRMLNNYEWMSNLTLLDFLGSVGRHARLTTMLNRESVASRLAPSSSTSASASGSVGMSYTEFSYQLLQAYDFLHLHRTTSCTIQLGGSDQLGNIVAGIDLIRRTTGLSNTDPAYGLTLPLLTTSSGEKFGKSAGNAIWLDPNRTSDFDFYQFFLKSSDADVEKYLLALTLLEPEKVSKVMEEHKGRERERGAQRVLADHITSLIRGREAGERCKRLTEILFQEGRGDVRESLRKLDVNKIGEGEGVVMRMKKDEVVGVDITKVVVGAGLVKSRGEAKRMLVNGGLYLNNEQVKTERVVTEEDMVVMQRGAGEGGALCLIKAGKGNVRILHLS